MHKFKRCLLLVPTIALTVLAGLLQTGCSKKEVEGQVFIVTQGGENIKLGLIDVYVIPDDTFRQIATNVTEELVENAQARQSARQKLETDKLPLRDASESLIALKVEVDATLNGIFRREALDWISKADAEIAAKQIELEASIPIPHAKDVSAILSAELYGQVPAGKSDADGIFRVKAKKGDVIYASGSRRVVDGSEYYNWVVPITDTKSRLLIANDTLAMQPEVVMVRLLGAGDPRHNAFEDLLAEIDEEDASLAYRLLKTSGRTISPDLHRGLQPDTRIAEYAGNLLMQVTGKIDVLRSQAEQARLEAQRQAEQARLEAQRQAEQARLEAERRAEAFRAWLEAPEGKDMVMDVAGVTLEMQWIAPGEFSMGSPNNESGRFSDEGPQTRVRLTKGYWLGKYPVTQGQWQALMGSNPSHFKNSGLNAPVERVSWNDAMDFARRLTEQERRAGRLPDGYVYTLPSEAQWEYAARAGTTTRFYTGNSDSDLGRAGWFSGNSGRSTKPVGQKVANAWGLYDMHGNVWEWTRTWYGNYPGGSVVDYEGPASGSGRFRRGGSWYDGARYCRSAFRFLYSPGARNNDLGFRLALSSVP